MPEELGRSVIEAEIADLTREIDARRKMLEAQGGVVVEAPSGRELVRTALIEKMSPGAPLPQTSTASTIQTKAVPQAKKTASYLDDLDEETIEKVNQLIEYAFAKGIKKALARAYENDPAVADAFHDALVDKLYAELKTRGVVN